MILFQARGVNLFMALNRTRFFAACMLLAVAARADIPPAVPSKTAGKSSLVALEVDGRLSYAAYTTQGDVLPDFSNCGYGGGGVALPQAVVCETLQPEPGNRDDSARIQAALERVANLPIGADGLRGAVLLKRGGYRCAEVLKIQASGVVLRGEGDGEDGTVITVTARAVETIK